MLISRRSLSLALMISLFLTLIQPLMPLKAADLPAPSFGQVLDARKMEIGPGATYTWYDMKIERGLEKVHFVEFDPRNPSLDLQPGKTDGKVYGMQGVMKMASDADKPGNRVIAAVNGDFYDLATGIPLGYFMGDQRILTSPPNDWFAFGLKADGTTLYGPSPKLTRTVTIGGTTSPITTINRQRSSDALVLFTSDFHTSTTSNDLGDEVVLDIIEGEMKSGQTLRLRVAEIRTNKGNTPLMEGQVVLSASGTRRALLAGLQPGDEVTASFELEAAWRDVKMAIGGSELLVKDGVVTTNSDPAFHPRTAIGTKADGSVVMIEIDGRTPGFSEGVQLMELGKIMKDLGVVNALNLDGGGSSTFVARLPGETTRKILNRPSDGGERKTANGLLLVNKAPEGPASRLVIQPSMDRVLTNSSIGLKAAAVDANGHPAVFTDAVSWNTDAGSGTITSEGRFTAGSVPGSANITATAGSLTGTGEIEIVNELTEIKFPDAERTFTSGTTVQLPVTSLRNGQVIQTDNSRLQWRVEGPIGTIDTSGKFTATTETEKAGKIYVKFNDVETSMDVKVGLPPVILEDFESGLAKYLPSAGAQFKTAKASIENNEDLVRFGKQSLKLEYDFTGTPGTSGVYLSAKDVASRIQVPGYPEKIGMWVYGDGHKHWLRAQMRDKNGTIALDFVDQAVGVNWIGWKYVEASVPKGRALPLTMDMPVRYMETSAAKKDAGVIYIDQIRAVYGPVNDDLDPPIIKNIFPAENSTVTSSSITIRAIAEDFGYNPVDHPGTTLIDPDKIRMYIDGTLVPHALYPPEGRISYVPSVPLADGVHQVRLRVKDLFGNESSKEWTFNVDTGSSKMVYTAPSVTYAGNTYSLDVNAVRAAGMKDGQLSFGFNPSKVENLQVIGGSKVQEGQFEAQIDPALGTVTINWKGIDTAGLTDADLLGQISYRIKADAAGTNEITFRSGRISFTDSGITSFPFFGLPLSSEIKNHLRLSWEEDGIAQGYETSLKVTDESGAGVSDARILADGVEIGRTDGTGVLKTAYLTATLKEYKLQAVKDIAYSPVMAFKVSLLAGSPTPNNISVTMGTDPAASRAFTWHTHPGTEATVVEMVKQTEFTDFSASNVQKIYGSGYLYNTTDIGTVRVHKAAAIGLAPGTRYVYRVGDGNGNYSSQGNFQTTDLAGDHTKFLYFADSQAADLAGYQLWGNTVKKAVAEHPDAEFILHAGDMVDSGFKEKEWNMWFNAVQEQLLSTTLVSVIGNHEVMGTKGNNDFLSHFNQPGNGLDSLKGTNFSYDYKDMHFVVLNSEEQYEEQKEWLRKDLAATNKKWKIVAFHRGPYGSIYDTEIVRSLWTPVFDEFKVDLVLNGHEHIYLRTYPMNGGKPAQEGKGTTYVVAGTTGPKFYSLTQRDWQKVTDAELTQMYATVEMEGNDLKFVTKTVGGRVVDQFTLTKPVAQQVLIDKPEVHLTVGDIEQLNATVLPNDAINKSVTWSVYGSTPDSAVTVSESGLVTAQHVGTAVVRAQSVVSGVYAESIIHVQGRLESLSFTGLTELKVGEDDQTVTEGVYTDGIRIPLVQGVNYASSNPVAATIDPSGIVHAWQEGTTVISATYGGFSGQYELTVRALEQPGKKLVRLEIVDVDAVMVHHSSQKAEVAAYYNDGTIERIKKGAQFSSSRPDVAEIKDNGIVKTVSEGTTILSASYGNLTVSKEIKVIVKKKGHDADD
jgi:large repetitive protein